MSPITLYLFLASLHPALVEGTKTQEKDASKGNVDGIGIYPQIQTQSCMFMFISPHSLVAMSAQFSVGHRHLIE